MGLMRLSNIANYLTLERDLSAAVQFVALNACESGLPCRFYVSRLNSDLTLHHIASFGFSEEFIALNSKFSLLTNPLLDFYAATTEFCLHTFNSNEDGGSRREP